MGTPNTVCADWQFAQDTAARNWIEDPHVDLSDPDSWLDTNLCIRWLLDNTGNKDETDGYNLEYRVNAGEWTPVTTSTNYVKAVDSPNFTDGDGTSQELGSGTFDEGFWDDDGGIASFTLAQGQESENEHCFQFISADCAGNTIELQPAFDGGADLDGYTYSAPSCAFAAGTPEVSEAETVTVSDSPTVGAPAAPTRTVSEAEGLTVSDSPAVALALEVSESETVTLAATVRRYSETIYLLDTPTISIEGVVAPRNISEAEAITVSDAPLLAMAALIVSRAEGVDVSDAPAVSIGAQPDRDVSETEALTVSDSLLVSMAALAASRTESITVADVILAVMEALRAQRAESITAGDDPTVAVQGVTLGITITEGEDYYTPKPIIVG